jgi:hypothetical protein
MAEDDPFADLIRRVRTGDSEAAAELVRQFEPEIRRRVRNWLRLHGPGLRPVFESMNVCQSVLADFFSAGSTGQYDLDRPERVLALLTTMARNKLKVLSRDQHRQRRDVRRTQPLDSEAGGRLVDRRKQHARALDRVARELGLDPQMEP